MRARDKMTRPRDLERFLRRHGFSKREAMCVVSHGWRGMNLKGQPRQGCFGATGGKS